MQRLTGTLAMGKMTDDHKQSSTSHADSFRIGEWIVHPSLNRIEGHGGSISIEPRIMDVLTCLAARQGDLLSRQELLEEVWGDVFVGEEALTRAVSELRRILDDDTRKPKYIETIRKRGYRLVSPVQSVTAERPGKRVEPDAARSKFPKAILWVIPVVVAIAAYWSTRPQPNGTPSQPLRVVPLTSYPGSEQFPALSPDGSMVAFGWDGPEQDNMDVYVKQVGEEQPLRLTDHPSWDTYPVWVPGGESITYIHGDESGVGIFEVPLLGGEPRQLVPSQAEILGFTWLDEGRNMVYSTRPEPHEQARLVRREIGSGVESEFPLPPGAANDMMPLISPDGETLAFVRSLPSGDDQIHLVPAGRGVPRRLSEGLGTLEGLSWSRDGRSMIFSCAMNGNYALWRIDVESGDISWIPVHGEWMFHPSAARDADRMAYQHRWFEKNIWQVTEGHGDRGLTTAPLITSTRWDCEAYYSPDGERLAFTSARSGFLEIWVCRADGERPVQLTRFNGPSVASPRWSPDGARVAFAGSPDGFSDVFVIEYADRAVRPVVAGTHNDVAPSWSGDGRWIYFGSDRSGSWELWKATVDDEGNGNPIRLTSEGGACGLESPDGRYVYYTRKAEAGLWRLPLGSQVEGSGVERVLAHLPHLGDWSNWAIWSGGLVLLDHDEGGPLIVRYDPETGETTAVANVPNVASPSLAVSPGGRRILYARIEKSVTDLVLVEGFR